MKIKDGYILREVASSNIVVPVGSAQMSFSGIMTLNTVGAFVWKQLENDVTIEKIVNAVIKEYEIDKETANRDINIYINKLRDQNLIED